MQQDLLCSPHLLPAALVFDLDDTLWSGDVDCTAGGPFIPKTRRGGGRSSKEDSIEYADRTGNGLCLFKDVPQIMRGLVILREAANNNRTNNFLLASARGSSLEDVKKSCQIGYASRTTSPPSARELLDAIVVNPEASQGEKLTYNQLADACILKPCDKQFHIKRICQQLQCQPDEILFFDNEMRNIESTRRINVVAKYCPYGLTWDVLEEGLKEYAQTRLAKRGSSEDIRTDSLYRISAFINHLKQLSKDKLALKQFVFKDLSYGSADIPASSSSLLEV